MLQAGVDFTILVEIGGVVPTAVLVMQEQDVAFSDVDEEADVAAAATKQQIMQSVTMANPLWREKGFIGVTYCMIC